MSGHNQLEFPTPTPEEQALSEALSETIHRDITEKGGRISFAEFMQLALYAPQQGYYVNGRPILGEQGDFTTGPELTPVFSQCMGNQIMQIAQQLDDSEILEFGGGSGALAAETLAWLEQHNALPEHYYILEVSPYLQATQRDRLLERVPQLIERVHWVSAIPDNFRGTIVANEVLDAMPVHRVCFHSNGEHREIYVQSNGAGFMGVEGEISSPELSDIANRIYAEYGDNMADGYIAEVNLYARGWINMLYQKLEAGVVLLVDYGYPRSQWFIADRFQGTLMCHYRHRAHSEALILPGLQDITAHVDFTLIAEHAHDAGFQIAGYTNQSSFLTGCGLEALIQGLDQNDIQQFLSATGPIKKLMLPHEMGEVFKVIGLSKGRVFDLSGLELNDQTWRL